MRAFARRDHLDLPAVAWRRIALVHAEQVAGEQRGLVAAGAGADFQDHVALVHRVLRDQREADLLRERVALFLERRLLGFGERAHLGIGRGVGEHRVEIGDLALRRPVGRDGRHQRLQLGELARQLHIGVAVGAGREVGLDRLEAGHQRVELGLGQRDGHRRQVGMRTRGSATSRFGGPSRRAFRRYGRPVRRAKPTLASARKDAARAVELAECRCASIPAAHF